MNLWMIGVTATVHVPPRHRHMTRVLQLQQQQETAPQFLTLGRGRRNNNKTYTVGEMKTTLPDFRSGDSRVLVSMYGFFPWTMTFYLSTSSPTCDVDDRLAKITRFVRSHTRSLTWISHREPRGIHQETYHTAHPQLSWMVLPRPSR